MKLGYNTQYNRSDFKKTTIGLDKNLGAFDFSETRKGRVQMSPIDAKIKKEKFNMSQSHLKKKLSSSVQPLNSKIIKQNKASMN